MTTNEKTGYEFAQGAIKCCAELFAYTICILLIYWLFRGLFGWDLDDSDQSSRLRSGLTVHTDAKTGVQYLSDGHGGLVVRAKGEPK